MTPDAALRDAQRRFGGHLVARGRTHDADVLVWLETIGQDVRYALRSLRHSPVVTAIVVASSDLDELMGLCHRIVVLARGRVAAELGRDAFSREALLAAALGTAASDLPA